MKKWYTPILLAAVVLLAGMLVGLNPGSSAENYSEALPSAAGPEEPDLESQVNAYLSQEESFQYLVRFDLKEDSASIAVLTRDEPLSDEMSQYVISLVAEQGGYAPEAVHMMWIVERRPQHQIGVNVD